MIDFIVAHDSITQIDQPGEDGQDQDNGDENMPDGDLLQDFVNRFI